MKSLQQVCLLCACALCGALGVAVTHAILSQPAPLPNSLEMSDRESNPGRSAAVELEVRDLNERIQSLQAQLRDLTAQVQTTSRTPVGPAESGSGPGAPLPDATEQAYKQLRDHEEQQRAKQAMDRDRERILLDIKKMTPQLGLSIGQATQLQEILIVQSERNRNLERMWREGRDMSSIKALRANNVELHVQELTSVLSSAQLESYRDYRSGTVEGATDFD